MSRIVVKNLPKKITEDKVRQIFGEKGLLTDVQLKYTTDGKFRQFAFIGYHNEQDANEAIKFFHNTCIKTNKITVELCALLGDAKKPKSWSKYSSDTTISKNEKSKDLVENDEKNTKEKKKSKSKELLEKYKDDPLFEEFMNVHAPNELKLVSNKKSINEEESRNEDSEAESEQASESEKSEADEKKEKIADQQITDMEYMKSLMRNKKESDMKTHEKIEKKVKPKIDLFTLKLRYVPPTCKKKDVKQFFNPVVPFSIRIPRGHKGIAYVGFKTEKQFNKALLKHRSFMSGKRISVVKYNPSKNQNQMHQNEDPKKLKWRTQEELLKNEEDIAESGKIFIRNLSYTTTENDVQELFSKYGPITEVNLPVDSSTRKSKGFGVITFLMPEHAVKAYTELDGSILHGRMLHLLPGIAKDSKEDDTETKKSYKEKKAKQQKSQAGSSHNWNSLFLGSNAVAEVIADTYSTTKEAVLDPHGSSSAAVRLALGETQIVSSTKSYLEQEGVLLDAFNGPITKRSKTIILVKNLPANTGKKEIYNTFEKFGVVGRVILPPSGITAIVEFVEPSEARKAYTSLAYSKFKNLPLYLEWAPENSLSVQNSEHVKKDSEEKTVTNPVLPKPDEKPAEDEIKDDEEPEPDTTLFVKNLNFATADEALHQHFKGCGKLHYATVATKKDKNNPDKKISMGYGFVRFMLKECADKALKTLQQSILDGKSLEIKRSERTLKGDVPSARKLSKKTKQTGSKILIRNIPFQANKNEIMELFRTFGEIKALRLPKKMSAGSDSHRGFAFVDFVSASDAKKAFEALCQSTHLYGRRLVLEWATTDDGIEEIRKRTADHFHEKEESVSKKSVFSLEKT